MKIIKNYIHGEITSKSSKYFKIDDPSKGEEIGKVVIANEVDFKNTIISSKKGFDEWSEYTPLQRSRVISKFKDIIEKNITTLAEVISLEHGKTLDDAKGSVIRGLEVVEFSCGIPHLIKGEFSQNIGKDIDSWSIRQPLESRQVLLHLIFLLYANDVSYFNFIFETF